LLNSYCLTSMVPAATGPAADTVEVVSGHDDVRGCDALDLYTREPMGL